MRDYNIAANTSRNSFSVALRTFAAEIPWHHWKAAESRFRCAHTCHGVKRPTEAPRGLSAAISIPDQSAAIDSEFSLLSAAILSLVFIINSPSSLCHPRSVLARLVNTFRRCGLHHLTQSQFASLNTVTVCITQHSHSLHHLTAARFERIRAATVCIT